MPRYPVVQSDTVHRLLHSGRYPFLESTDWRNANANAIGTPFFIPASTTSSTRRARFSTLPPYDRYDGLKKGKGTDAANNRERVELYQIKTGFTRVSNGLTESLTIPGISSSSSARGMDVSTGSPDHFHRAEKYVFPR